MVAFTDAVVDDHAVVVEVVDAPLTDRTMPHAWREEAAAGEAKVVDVTAFHDSTGQNFCELLGLLTLQVARVLQCRDAVEDHCKQDEKVHDQQHHMVDYVLFILPHHPVLREGNFVHKVAHDVRKDQQTEVGEEVEPDASATSLDLLQWGVFWAKAALETAVTQIEVELVVLVFRLYFSVGPRISGGIWVDLVLEAVEELEWRLVLLVLLVP